MNLSYEKNTTGVPTLTDESDVDSITDILVANNIQYTILQSCQLLAIPCYLFLFYHFWKTPTIRKGIDMHVFILIVILNFITLTGDLSVFLNYIRTNSVWLHTHSFCLYWMWIDNFCYTLGMWLTAWGSIERHILIFHRNLLNTFKQRLIVHYIPLTFCIAYCCVYSSYLVFGYPCENVFDYTSVLCGSTCAYGDFYLAQYDTIANSIVTTILIVLCSISLLFRVLWKRRHYRRGLQWAKIRKMTIQLLSISSLYMITTIPVNTEYLIGYVSEDSIAYSYLSNMMYLLYCVLPFVCLTTLPELRQKLRICRIHHHHRAVAPTFLFHRASNTIHTIHPWNKQ
ncbi:unnamed protein product [Adineta ricciae]|uniref:Uncharacterized protein n=1 Tax=Adineta ricciae TaxID=249248 RepID=A0A815SSW0_ADIRI|nr:unnamed protein product [Adineta ricciae]CAF1494011.1 unnamed protein product [Adineta ricciae]